MKIEDQYKNLFNSSIEPKLEDEMWQQIENDLQRKEFYGFSFYHFNIYYAGIILCSLLSTGYMAYHALSSPEHVTTIIEKEIKVIEVEEEPTQQTSRIESPQLKTDTTTKNQPHSTQTITQKQHTSITREISNEAPIKKEEKELQHEESAHIVTKETETVEQPNQSADVESIIIHHRDTIIKYDSVKVSRRKLKKLQQSN